MIYPWIGVCIYDLWYMIFSWDSEVNLVCSAVFGRIQWGWVCPLQYDTPPCIWTKLFRWRGMSWHVAVDGWLDFDRTKLWDSIIDLEHGIEAIIKPRKMHELISLIINSSQDTKSLLLLECVTNQVFLYFIHIVYTSKWGLNIIFLFYFMQHLVILSLWNYFRFTRSRTR